MRKTLVVPTDDEIRRVIYESRRFADPRVVSALALMLSEGLTVNSIAKLQWANWDRAGRSLMIPHGSRPPRVILLSDYLTKGFDRIQRTTSPFIFSADMPGVPNFRGLINQLLLRADLSTFSVGSLVAWSKMQTPTVRRMTATT